MNIKGFIDFYKSDINVKNLVADIKNAGKGVYYLNGMSGSSTAVISTAVSASVSNSSLFVLPDKESAVYFFNDIENLNNEKDISAEERSIFFLPSSYKKPFDSVDIDSNSRFMRSEVINRISLTKNKTLIVTYPEAITEKVISKKSFKKNILSIEKDESVSIDILIDILTENSFERVDFVVEPGQFSVRGGIVDVFSFAYEYPFRIEVFGDHAESLRTFNPESQLTIKQFDKIEIIPDIQKMVSSEKFASLLAILPSNTLIWMDDSALLIEMIDKSFKKAVKIFDSLYHDNENLLPEDVLVSAELFKEQIDNSMIIEFGQKNIVKKDNIYEFKFSPQPSFNKNFKLLKERLEKKSSEKYKNLIFSDNLSQIERLHSIFDSITEEDAETKDFQYDTVMIPLKAGFIDYNNKIACYTDHQIFDKYHRYRLRDRLPAKQAVTLKEFNNLKPGDYVTHIDHGIGKYSGLAKIDVNGKMQEAIRLVYKGGDVLYISIHSLHRIARYTGKDGEAPSLNKLGSNAWNNLKNRAKQKVKDIAKDLIKLYAKRKMKKGFSFSPDSYLQNELEASFIYEDTPDQLKATKDVKYDMEKEYPMDRLVCGDVGFGKTEVAMRAAFKAVNDSKQVAVLVPTTVLALQHYHTFTERFKDFPCKVDYINRFRTTKEKKNILKDLQDGKIDVLIGTHRIVSSDVKFKDLGLLIIDEEQKFGVSIKEKLKKIKVNVDTLTLTATPIPRTLQFSLMGARDLSLINTPPQNRYPIITEVHTFNNGLIKETLMYEISRGGQVFFVHNRVQNITEIAELIKRLCPDIKVAVGHGQMEGAKLEKVMVDFISGEYDVLVSTSIIESGLDIPNANTIIINNAHHFGLSDLHQMRGRVGRSNKKAFCYLIAPPLSTITGEARKRLKALEEFSELGSGFNISMRDLDIRGAGNILGAEQSGFIADVGYETYQKILDEAIVELKESEFKDVFEDKKDEKDKPFVEQCLLETDIELLLPSDYVSSVEERLVLYKELDSLKSIEELKQFEVMLRDRFGPIPQETIGLFEAVKLRWFAAKLGFEKVIIKLGKFIGYFVSDQESQYYNSETFNKVLKFVQQNGNVCKLKETKQKLSITIDNVYDINDAFKYLKKIDETLLVAEPQS